MKLSWGFILSSLYCAASAAKLGHVYLHDPVSRTSTPTTSSSVDPETARLILAQRLGLARFHSIKHPSEETVRQLNAYGGRQQKLFGGDDSARTKAQVLIWLEDVEDDSAIISDSWKLDGFSISNPPSASDNDHLIQDMALQAESLPKYADPKGYTYGNSIDVEAMLSKLKKAHTYNDYLVIFRADGTDDLSSTELSGRISRLLVNTASLKEEGYAVTIVCMPPSSVHTKRAANPYGTYDLPSKIEAPRQLTEAPLSLASSKPSTSPAVPADLEDFPVITQAESNDSAPVLGILPRCFSSNATCQKQTHNCSGHGMCVLLQKGQGGSDSATTDCYGCACTPTVAHVGPDHGMETKKKTTYWGGPACQKKDVSVPFWLFVGSGVMLAFLIGSGIGMLYSMGSEELPSVIGAGVSGPTRK